MTIFTRSIKLHLPIQKRKAVFHTITSSHKNVNSSSYTNNFLLSGSPSLNIITNLSSSNSSTMYIPLLTKIKAVSTYIIQFTLQESKKFKFKLFVHSVIHFPKLNKTHNTFHTSKTRFNQESQSKLE